MALTFAFPRWEYACTSCGCVLRVSHEPVWMVGGWSRCDICKRHTRWDSKYLPPDKEVTG